MENFTLHPQLEADTFFIKPLSLSEVRLMNNAHFPWLILVPKHPDLIELYDLTDVDQRMLLREITALTKYMKHHTQCDKINIASFGNVVPQLHIHLIARFTTDLAWPKSALGAQSQPYEEQEKIVEIWQHRLHNIVI